MVSLTAALVVGLVACLLGLVLRLRARRLAGVPRQQEGPFFIGGLIHFLRNFHRNNDWLLEKSLQFGGTWGCTAPLFGPFSGGFICITDEAAVEHILNNNFDNYVKGDLLNEVFHEFLGDGIFATDGSAWRSQRKIASHMFSQRLLKEGLKVALFQGDKVMTKLYNAADQKTSVDLQDLFFRFTIDTFCFIAFGIDLNSLEKDHPFAKAFDASQQGVYERFSYPMWRLARMFQTPAERKLAHHVHTMDSFANEIIHGRRRELDSGSALGPDLLSRFLTAQKLQQTGGSSASTEAEASTETPADNSAEDTAAPARKMTDRELRDVVINFVIAGRDTTACALSWTFYELLRYPDVIAKLRLEIEPVLAAFVAAQQAKRTAPSQKAQEHRLPDDNEEYDNLIDYKELTDLPYLHAVVAEVLRLHPSVPKQSKYAVNDDVLPDGTAVKAGICVVYSSYAMGRNPKVWGEDATEFRPERWLDSQGKLKPQPSAYKNIVFNAGPRLCLGKPLAYLEIKLMLSMILSLFDVQLSRPASEEYNNSLVIAMKHGIHVKVARRA